MTTPLLEVRNVNQRFGGLLAVSDVSFDLFEGEILGLIGPNGAGKSTSFNLIAGTYAATSGEVHFAGEPILGLPPHEIAARGVLRTFQHNRPFTGMSVLDNVLVGAHTRFRSSLLRVLVAGARAEEAERREKAAALIEFVALAARPETPAENLSFGQGRLLEIARALAGEPRLMLFDEPAAGLTLAECDRVAAVIRSIAARGIGVLLIEHDMHFLLPLAHRVAVLNFGAKIADGVPDAIRAHPAVMDAYLGSHVAP
jgi:branched-chain amino acid transport system ATP-binding protein